jgi:hypothetical protein
MSIYDVQKQLDLQERNAIRRDFDHLAYKHSFFEWERAKDRAADPIEIVTHEDEEEPEGLEVGRKRPGSATAEDAEEGAA